MKVLIAYASKTGTTQKAAELIADVFQSQGWMTECMEAKMVRDITKYDAVIIGGGIRAGNWLADAAGFVRRFQKDLSQGSVAFFTVCLTIKADTSENRKTVNGYLDPIRKWVIADDEGYFPGKMKYAQLSWLPRLLISKLMKIPEGDYFNADVIQAWASQLSKKWLAKS